MRLFVCMRPNEIDLINEYKKAIGDHKYNLLLLVAPILQKYYIPYHENVSINSIDGELWNAIPGYENCYLISNYARIKSLPKTNRTNDIILKQHINECGYCEVRLYTDTSIKCWLIHRLMIFSFKNDEFDPKKEINHISGIKTQNILVNLENSNDKDNVQHAIKMGLRNSVGESHSKAKLTEKEVSEIFHSNEEMKTLSTRFNISISVVSAIKSGSAWKHLKLKEYEKQYGLSDEFVLKILNDTGSYKSIAIKHGVSKTTVQYIKNGIRYSQITGVTFKKARS